MELQFMRAFEGDVINIIPANKATAEAILGIPSHTTFTLILDPKVRTEKQQAAIEVYCRELAKALNESGYDMRNFPWKEGATVPWTQASVKDRLWRPIQEVMLDKKSTTKLDRAQVNQVYEVLARNMAERCGVSVEFPHREEG